MSCFGFVWSLVFGRTITVNEQTYSIIRRIGEGGERSLVPRPFFATHGKIFSLRMVWERDQGE